MAKISWRKRTKSGLNFSLDNALKIIADIPGLLLISNKLVFLEPLNKIRLFVMTLIIFALQFSCALKDIIPQPRDFNGE